VTLRPVYGQELAHWDLYAGDIDGAREVLKSSISGAGDTADSAIYENLREYYLLLSAKERDSFIESYARVAERNPLHSALSLSLLYGLHGDNDKAREQLSKLLDLRPMTYRTDEGTTPSYRTWNFILTAGVQFQLWGLNPLASDLWEKSLADEALISLQGNQAGDVVREIRMRLFAQRLVDANAADAGELVNDYMQANSPENAGTLMAVLESGGFFAQSVKLGGLLWQSQPDDQHLLRSLLNACRSANDAGTEKSILQMAWSHPPRSSPDMGYLQISLELIHRLVFDSHDRAAQKVCEETLRLYPQNRELLIQAGNIYARRHIYDLAERAYRQLLVMQPSDTLARDSLVSMLESAGKAGAALELLVRSGASGPDETARIAKLYLQTGDFDKAGQAVQHLLQPRSCDKIAGIATLFAAKGRDRQAGEMLRAALAGSKEPGVRFGLLSSLLETLPANTAPDLVERLLGRLESDIPAGSQPGSDPDLQTAFYDLKETLAKKFHREDGLQGQLAGEWKEGRGRPGAGLKLIQIEAAGGQQEKLRATCESLFTRPDFNEQILTAIQPALEAGAQYDLLAKGWEILAGKNPLRDDPILHYAGALASGGRKSEAAAALEKLGGRHVFSDVTASGIAQEYCREGNYEAAGEWFAIAVKKTPAARTADVYYQYAWMLLDLKDFSGAKRILLEAFRNPSAHDVQALARYFAESGHADHIGPEIGEFGLTPGATADFRAQLLLYYQQHGEPLKAIAVAEEHPEIISLCHDVPKWLRAAAEVAGTFEKPAALLERAIAQSPDEVETWVGDELALIYRDWPDAGSAPDHLKRANELKPLDFDIVVALSKLYLDKHQPQQAARVLSHFITLSQDLAQTERAKVLLAAIPAG